VHGQLDHHYIGDGSLFRIIMTVQRKHFDPPREVAGFNGAGKYARGRRG
jgi:hypothetical protein